MTEWTETALRGYTPQAAKLLDALLDVLVHAHLPLPVVIATVMATVELVSDAVVHQDEALREPVLANLAQIASVIATEDRGRTALAASIVADRARRQAWES